MGKLNVKNLFRKKDKAENTKEGEKKKELTADDKREIIKDIVLLVLGMATFSTIVIWLFAEIAPNKNCTYNCILAAPIFGLLLTLTRRYKITVLISAALFSVAYYVNAIVFTYRFAPIVFQDFFNYKEAGRVADRFELFLDNPMKTHIFGALFLAMLFWAIELLVEYAFKTLKHPKKQTSKELYFGLGTLLFTVVLILAMDLTNSFPVKNLGINVNDYTDRCGLLFAWYSEYKTSSVEPPVNYDPVDLQAQLDECKTRAEEESDEMKPDIVLVIMNESLADYSLLGNPRFAGDPLSQIHARLEEDPKRHRGMFAEGSLAVSVYGGNTCNSELEYLTGSSMAFYPEGSCPYIRYIKKPTASFVRDFGLDSQAIAVHPYYGAEWNRKTVYPLMGFDEFISGENFSKEGYHETNVDTIQDHHIIRDSFGDDLEYVRGFISDQECFNKLLELEQNNPENWRHDNEEDKDPMVIFTVSIMNHGGYTGMDETFESKAFTVYDEGNEYLTSTTYTDEAFIDLITHLERRPEKIAVLMFGDHQPSLENINYYITMNSTYRDNEFKKYIVPYFIWTNYKVDDPEIPEDTISLNYLSAVFKDTVGIPLTDWDRFRLDTMEEYPVLTANFTVDKYGRYRSILDTKDKPVLQNYEAMQYYRMFDMKVDEQ